jgi:hypothetical protein
VLTTIKVNLRERNNVFWLFAFPIILSSLFFGMFSGLGGDAITPQRLAVVHDSNWDQAYGVQSFVDTLSDGGTTDQHDSQEQTLIAPHEVESVDSAKALTRSGDVDGYLYVDNDGKLSIAVLDVVIADATNSIATTSSGVTLTALKSLITQFNQQSAMSRALASDATQTQSSSREQLTASPDATTSYGYTKDRAITHFAPDPFARYYYALLGMTCMMSMTYAVVSITLTQANLSALGARRSIAPLAKWRQVSATLCASCFASFLSLLVAFVYIRYVCGISAGGREPLAVVAIALSSLLATAYGLLIGSIARLSQGMKIGICTIVACIGALFAGLYGQYAMNISDAISRNMPAVHLLNPVKQVSDLFYDLLYYDSYQPFLQTSGVILAMSALCLSAAVMLMRRQRYEHL